MIHGEDVSRAILAVHRQFELANRERWLLTDGRVYDWWDLASAWGETESRVKAARSVGNGSMENGGDVSNNSDGRDYRGPQAKWVKELMMEEDVRGLPRPPEMLGRAQDSREFWYTFGLEPARARLD